MPSMVLLLDVEHALFYSKEMDIFLSNVTVYLFFFISRFENTYFSKKQLYTLGKFSAIFNKGRTFVTSCLLSCT